MYRCLVVDPPWPQRVIGHFKKRRHSHAPAITYRTMSLEDIAELRIGELAADGAHLWLWTTNAHLADAFKVMSAWGFTYLTTITWVKPSGVGAWFAHTTQHCLFGYFRQCRFNRARFKPTHLIEAPRRPHSRKPDAFYNLVRAVSDAPRIDVFNRRIIYDFDGVGDQSPPKQWNLRL